MIGLLAALTLFLTPPDVRENEAPFYSNEVDYYEVFRNGELYLTVTPTREDGSADLEVTEDGDYQARIFDSEGLVSALGESLSVNNAVRAVPRPPGLTRSR